MAEFLQYLIAGLSNGAIYALIALGWVLIFNISGVLNLAQGEFLMLGALVFAWTEENTGLPIASLDRRRDRGRCSRGVAVDVVAIRQRQEPDDSCLSSSSRSERPSCCARSPASSSVLTRKRHDYLVGGDPIIINGAALLPATILIWVVVVVAVCAARGLFPLHDVRQGDDGLLR